MSRDSAKPLHFLEHQKIGLNSGQGDYFGKWFVCQIQTQFQMQQLFLLSQIQNQTASYAM